MLSAIVSLVTGYIEARAIGRGITAAENWAYEFYRLMMSLFITILCTFSGIWGLTALGMYAKGTEIRVSLGVGFATALLVTSAVVANLWKSSALTKGIPLALPVALEQAAEKQDVTITTRS